MMEKEKLRKADIFSGSLIVLLGLYVISQAVQMPMKDSWGGVQNVWFVSHALFRLFVGAMIVLLGIALTINALKTVGFKGMANSLSWLKSPELIRFLKSGPMLRFLTLGANKLRPRAASEADAEPSPPRPLAARDTPA